MLFFCTGNKILSRMTKTTCKNKKDKKADLPKYICKKCDSTAKKKKKLCKPKKIKE